MNFLKRLKSHLNFKQIKKEQSKEYCTENIIKKKKKINILSKEIFII